MEPMVIKVHGVPGILPHDRMVDQLKIHFLKRRNSGGDVLSVIYPTSTPGQAYIIFESAKVPGVLECTHILDVDNRFYQIQIQKARLSEVDMPVETTLDLRMFPNPEHVLKLLKCYGFNVTQLNSCHLQLKGSFLKLKLIRNELIQLRSHEHQSHSRASSALHNGSTLGSDMESDGMDPRNVSKSISRNVDKMYAVSQHQLLDSAPSLLSSYRDSASVESPRSLQSIYSSFTERNASSPVNAVVQKYQRQDINELPAHRRSPLVDGASSLSGNSPSSLNLLHHTYRGSASGGSPRSLHSSYYSSIGSDSQTVDTMQRHASYGDSASGGSLRRRPSFSGETSPSSSHSSPSSSSDGMARFPVDTDIVTFILTQREDVVKVIEEHFGTEMVVQDNPGFSMVTFFGKNSDKAKAHLLNTIKELSTSLRTQEIHLKKYNHAEQKQILERIQRNKDLGVVIRHSSDVVKLIGFPKESFEMLQKILGHNDEPPRGRAMERNSKPRRSVSLPRKCKLADHAHVTDHENQANVASKYSPSRYQEDSDEGKAPQIDKGSDQTPDKNSRRTHSNSESREKIRTTREQTIPQDMELGSREKKSSTQKVTDRLKLHDLNGFKDLKFMISRKKNNSSLQKK